MIKTQLIFLLTMGIMVGCVDDVNSEKSVDNKVSLLISAESVSTVPLPALQQLSALAGQSELTRLVKYGVQTYKLVYATHYKGKPVKASGLLYVPINLTAPAPLISLQHGTTFTKDGAPSSTKSFTGMEYFAAAGYIALMPDYLGYGESSDLFHPYYDRQHSASSVIDMIHAAKDYLRNEGIAFNDQLFLAGYSEGGYVTLAAAKELDQNPAHNLTVTAVAAGAGGYNLNHMLERVTTDRQYSYPAYLAFVLMAYNNTYDWNYPLHYFFQDKYALVLQTYMNGKYDGWQINSKLTTEVKSLLNPDFLLRLKNPTEEARLKKALSDNSVIGWKTKLPIKLYHGTRDEIIPYQNSEITLQKFKDEGSQDITLSLITGGTHGSSFVPMLKEFVPWFESLRKRE